MALDFAQEFKTGVTNGLSAEDAQKIRDARNNKIGKAMTTDPSQIQYVNDQTDKDMAAYIKNPQVAGVNYTPGVGITNTRQNPTTPKFNVNGMLDQQAKYKIDAINSARLMNENKLNSQLPQIDQQYANIDKGIYTNARQSALGNEEVLANQGLGMGNGAVSSGYGETSRIMQDTALSNSLNQAELQKQQQKNEIAQAILNGGYTSDIESANAMADAKMQEFNAAINMYQFDKNYGLNEAGVTGTYNGQNTLAKQQVDNQVDQFNTTTDIGKDQFAKEFEFKKTQAAIDNKINEAGLTGVFNGESTLQGKTFEQSVKQTAFLNTLSEAELTGIYNGALTLNGKKVDADIKAQIETIALNKGIALGTVDGQSTLDKRQVDYATSKPYFKSSSGGDGGGGGETEEQKAVRLMEEEAARQKTVDDENNNNNLQQANYSTGVMPAYTESSAYVVGYGRISRNELNTLIENKEVIAYKKDDGTFYFEKRK